jgi:fatty acid-binding protein DegV
VPRSDVLVTQIGPVVGVHTGPRVIGVIWVERA